MRVIPAAIQAKLDAGAATLCWCWTLVRTDGVVMGFTDHDRALSVNGVIHRPGSARAIGDIAQATGFGADTAGFAGILEAEAVTETDLANGVYDDAEVRLYRVDWTAPSEPILVWRAHIGEIRRGETGFEAELRGPLARLDRTIGRVIQRRCDATLGDARCGVDVTDPALNGSGAVSAVTDRRRFLATGLSGFADGWFARGVLTWTDGANAGARAEVDVHRLAGALAALELLEPVGADIAIGDAFSVSAGCDKRWATCKSKFGNVPNFRGFPMTPGDDWVVASPRSGVRNDGGSLWTDREG